MEWIQLFHIVWDQVSPHAETSGSSSAGGFSYFQHAGLGLHMGPLVMVLSICSSFLQKKSGLPKMESSKAGFVLLFLPSGCFCGRSNIFRALFLRPGSSKSALNSLRGRVSGVLSSLMHKDLYDNLTLPTCGNEAKCC